MQPARAWRPSSKFTFFAALLLALTGCQDDASLAVAETFPYTTEDRIRFAESQQPIIQLAGDNARRIGSYLNISEPMNYGDAVWNDADVPVGRSWVLVDLKRQTMSVFRGSDEIGTAVTLYGVDQKPTPTGRFAVLEKRKDHQSSIYDAEMPYTLRLTYDGIAIHGSDVRGGLGTHGCLGIPLEFARRVFETLKVGDEVIILRDAEAEMRPWKHARAADVD